MTVVCSCGYRLVTTVDRRIVAGLVCPVCRMPLVNADIEETEAADS